MNVKERKSETVYALLKSRIIRGEMVQNEIISEDALAQELGISRTPITQALHLLAKDKFVRIYPRKGIVVADISIEMIHCVYEIRMLLEPYIVRNVCEKMDAEPLMRIKSEFEEQLSYLRANSSSFNINRCVELDNALHNQIADDFDNILLRQFLETVRDYNAWIRVHTSNKNRDYADSINQHLAIVNALLDRDPDAAEAAMREHITKAEAECYRYRK